jgi:hypothetical protein
MGRKRGRQQIVTGAGLSVDATLLMSGTAHADVFTVDGLQDAPDDGHTTLRDAIADAEKPAASGSTISVKKMWCTKEHKRSAESAKKKCKTRRRTRKGESRCFEGSCSRPRSR